MKRPSRNILTLGGGGRVLRFPGRTRTGDPEPPVLPAEDQLYLAIGRIAANWSLLEIVSGLVLTGLFGNQQETVAQAVVAGQRVENVWETIEVLLSSDAETLADQLIEFRSWRRSANGYRRRRNEAIHSAWSMTGSGGTPAAWDMMSQRAKRGARPGLFPGGISELEELARDIAACEERLTRLHDSIGGVLDGSPRRPG
jgi:hypothetical protein